MLIPGPQFPKDSLLPRGNISGRQKSIPRCKMPFQGRRRFEDAGEHLPMLAGAGGHLAPGHGGVGSRRRYSTARRVQLSLKIVC